MGLRRGSRGHISTTVKNRHGRVLGRQAPLASAALVLTSQTAYAYYVDRAGEALSSIDLGVYVSGTAAVGTGWAEIAIAKGSWSILQASVNLTMLGYADIDAEVKTGATANYTKTVSGISIAPEDDLWVVVASSHATTQASLRIFNGDGDRQGLHRRRANCRPSTNLNTPLAFTYTFGEQPPIVWAQLP